MTAREQQLRMAAPAVRTVPADRCRLPQPETHTILAARRHMSADMELDCGCLMYQAHGPACLDRKDRP